MPNNGLRRRRKSQAPGGMIGETGWASVGVKRSRHHERWAMIGINREHRHPAPTCSSCDMFSSLRVMFRNVLGRMIYAMTSFSQRPPLPQQMAHDLSDSMSFRLVSLLGVRYQERVRPVSALAIAPHVRRSVFISISHAHDDIATEAPARHCAQSANSLRA